MDITFHGNDVFFSENLNSLPATAMEVCECIKGAPFLCVERDSSTESSDKDLTWHEASCAGNSSRACLRAIAIMNLVARVMATSSETGRSLYGLNGHCTLYDCEQHASQ